MVTNIFGGRYAGRRVLITGHTGFKGSWLALWLRELGADLSGISLTPENTPNHWDLLGISLDDYRIDINNAGAVREAVRVAKPDIVFHLAAQSIVRRSYKHPLETWSTNVMGTAHVLDALRDLDTVKAVVVVTTDKCYENREWDWGYRETDRLGGYEPYSASKAAVELVAASFRRSFLMAPGAPALATARAGNVIGGGDWSEDRLVPDLVRAANNGSPLEIRSPYSTRPWQHVLDSLSGYLALGSRLLADGQSRAQAWNFGPEVDGNRTVESVLNGLQVYWPEMNWEISTGTHPHEAKLLYLDSSKAKTHLGWHPVWSFEQTLAFTAQWYRHFADTGKALSATQLAAYIHSATDCGVGWARK